MEIRCQSNEDTWMYQQLATSGKVGSWSHCLIKAAVGLNNIAYFKALHAKISAGNAYQIMTEKQKHIGLQRSIGVWDVVANVLNINIGSGIFLFPAIMAGILGPASVSAYLLCGLLFSLVVLCYAEISSQITRTGGTYAYIEEVWGPYIGFLANLLFIMVGVLAGGALLNALADTISVFVPMLSNIWWRIPFFIGVVAIIVGINILGIQQGMQAIRILLVCKLVPLILLIVAGVWSINWSHLHWENLPASSDLGKASLILFFAFVGGESALNISGEMKDPQRTAPRGILIGTFILILFFCLIQLTAQGLLGPTLPDYVEAPLAEAGRSILGQTGFTIMMLGAIMAILGTLNSVFLLFPRIMYAGAEDRLMPSWLGWVHPRFRTPSRAIVCMGVIILVLTLSGSFQKLSILVTVAMVVLYLGVVTAVIRRRWRDDHRVTGGLRLPGGITIPVLTLLVLGWFLWHLDVEEWIALIVFLMLASIAYIPVKKARNQLSQSPESVSGLQRPQQ